MLNWGVSGASGGIGGVERCQGQQGVVGVDCLLTSCFHMIGTANNYTVSNHFDQEIKPTNEQSNEKQFHFSKYQTISTMNHNDRMAQWNFVSISESLLSNCSTKHLSFLFSVVCVLCSSQTRLWPLPVQTQGTQLLKVFIQLYYNNSHQQYENEVSHSSMFKISMFISHKSAFESKDTKIDSNSQMHKNRQTCRYICI